MKSIIIIGAGSAIAQCYARLEASHGSRFVLVGRDSSHLERIRNDLLVRGSKGVEIFRLDVTEAKEHVSMFSAARSFLRQVDVVLVAHGVLPDQETALQNLGKLHHSFTVNATATILLLAQASALLSSQNRGSLVVISSVAGDRGRADNFVYGSAKAAVSAFASGLRQRLRSTDVNVLTVKPGLVDTPMTSNFKKGVLWSHPERVAKGIVRAIARRRSIVYLPFFWRYIMTIIRFIPEFAFRRMDFR